MTKAHAVLKLFRGFTLVPPLLACLCFGTMALYHTGQEDQFLFYLPYLILGGLSLLALNAASNSINQVFEVDLDRRAGKMRPIVTGELTRDEALSIGIMMYIASISIASLINLFFTQMIILIMLITWLYSNPITYFKKRLVLNNLSLAVPRGVFAIIACWGIVADPLDPLILSVALIMFTYTFGANITKDIDDAEADKEFGVRNFITTYSWRKATTISSICFVAPFVQIYMLVQLGFMPEKYLIMNMLALVSIVAIVLMPHENSTPRENHVAWYIFYIQMMLLMVGFTLTAILL